MTRILAMGWSLVVLASCSMGPMAKPSVPVCASDDECEAGQVCFVDGCGDPARNIVVEVTGSTLAGQYPQDFALPDGGLTGRLDLAMRTPLTVQGELQRELAPGSDPTNRTLYSDAVVVRAQGGSENLPGISRSYEVRYEKTERGVFSMVLGSGVFALSVAPSDPSIPPERQAGLVIRAQDPMPFVKFAFPSVDGTVILAGRLVKQRVSTIPPVDLALTDVAFDLQAFDPTTNTPLSQRVPVSSGTAGSRGDFVIALSPKVRDMGSFVLVASPREAGAMAPTRTFAIANPLPSAVTLELGDFGDPVEKVKGSVVDAAGAPIVGASVVVEGVVGGGGTFRSRVVLTDQRGQFSVDLLRNPAEGTLTATVAPPAGSEAAFSRFPVKVGPRVNDTVELTPGTLRCQDRIVVEGVVRTPTGGVATGVRVHAQELVRAGSRALAVEDPETLTDEDGRFTLHLDPGSWRFDFQPSDATARASRLVILEAVDRDTGQVRTELDLGTVQLPRGRRVEGVVNAISSQHPTGPVPYATVRFYRVAQVSGEPASLLMGETVADGSGKYSVVLPTR